MIDSNTFEQLTSSIEQELLDGHMSTAYDTMLQLLNMLSEMPQRNSIRQKTEEQEFNFSLMLKQMEEYGSDPERDTMLEQMRAEFFCQLQLLRHYYHANFIHDTYGETALRNITAGHTIASFVQEYSENLFPRTDQESMDRLFDILWTSPQLTSEETQGLATFIENHLTPFQQAYYISALTLSLLKYFDIAKLEILSLQANSTDVQVRAKALIGICACTQLHAPVLKLYSTKVQHVATRLELNNITEALTQIQHFICLYQENERVRQRFENEIFPTLIRLTQQRHKLGFDDMEIDLTSPHTTAKLNKQTRRVLKDGLTEMARMFQEGMDINLNTFTSLKSFQFFNHVGHWVLPFDINQPEMKEVSILDKMSMCDSDKFSIYCLYKKMSPEHQQGIRESITNHYEQFVDSNYKRNEYQNALQCLYRLLRRSPWTSMWPEFFSPDVLFIDNAFLQERINREPLFLFETGMLLLRNKHYEQAERHLSQLSKIQGADTPLLMNLGLCAQEQGKYQRAIQYYQQANMLTPDNQDLLYRMQYCYAKLEQYDEQLHYLMKLEEENPNDERILTEVGLCLIQLKKWDEAEHRFYKLVFIGKRIIPSLRALAWCATNKHDYALALKHYQRIFDETPEESTWEDCLNMGHAYWLNNDTSAAISRYTEYTHRYLSANKEATNAMEPFEKDKSWLMENGKRECDVMLMHDLVQRALTR